MKTPLTGENRAAGDVRLNELSPQDINGLTQFAERSLMLKGFDPGVGEDVTQRALMSVVMGLETGRSGRIPRPSDLKTKEAFVNYLRGIVSSHISKMGHERKIRAGFAEWEDGVAASADNVSPTPCQMAELEDLKTILFTRLRARAPQRLKRTIDAWEEVFVSGDRIPDMGDRHYVTEVKNLAQTIVTELGELR